MKGRKCQRLRKLLLLIPVLILISSCCTPPPVIPEKKFDRPVPPSIPALTWEDVPGYYGLDENSQDFDDLQEFFDLFEGYVEKVNNTFEKYEPDTEE